MAVKHKEIKRCKMIMDSMIKAHDFGPGALFVLNRPAFFGKCNVEVDEHNVVISKPQRTYFTNETLQKGDIIMFVDVVYDPYLRNHLLRFLFKEKMIAIVFRKGKTLKELRTNFDRIVSVDTDDGK